GCLPAGIAVSLLLLGTWLGRFSANADGAAGGLALALGFFAGYVAPGWAPLGPHDAWHWLPYTALLAIAVGFIATWVGKFRCLLRPAVAALVAWLLVRDRPDLAAVRPLGV